MNYEFLKENYNIDKRAFDLVESASQYVDEHSKELDQIREYNQIKVLNIYRQVGLSQSDFAYATGYGYGDSGRDKTEKIFAKLFDTEDSFVRSAISSGTHALAVTLFSLLNYGDKMLSITDHPYDTLKSVIGVEGDNPNSLINKGIKYDHIDLVDNRINFEKLKEKLSKEKIRLILIQRSTGYGLKRALTIDEIEEAALFIKKHSPSSIIMVDNCYGEFTDYKEPTQVGADVCVGSLIKNPGGAIALGGGYIAGSKDIIDSISDHFYAPGLGKETGLTYDTTRSTLQGLFFAPHISHQALKSALLFCKLYSDLGFKTYPSLEDKRSDIIQAIVFEDPDKVINFVQAIQMAASVGAHVVPYPWEMPGYKDQVIMASGGFIDGSSIEISADGPLRPPYVAYYQGGVVFEQAKLAAMISLSKFFEKKLI
ncbi:MAG: methionine gamma-lyase family protein [Tissierellia bacterium]|nr:methionine gamma-lyase family protein [Tissierellia bacterium]